MRRPASPSAERRAPSAARRRRRAEPPLELFDGIEWDDALIQAPRQRGDLVRLWRWIRRHQLPAQAVLVVGLVTVAYLLLIFGMLLGVAVGVVAEMAYSPPLIPVDASTLPATREKQKME